jgi:hypothetical protein
MTPADLAMSAFSKSFEQELQERLDEMVEAGVVDRVWCHEKNAWGYRPLLSTEEAMPILTDLARKRARPN